jgi:hypothetical protein
MAIKKVTKKSKSVSTASAIVVPIPEDMQTRATDRNNVLSDRLAGYGRHVSRIASRKNAWLLYLGA